MTNRDATTSAGGRLRIGPWLPSARSESPTALATAPAPEPGAGAHRRSEPDPGTTPVVTAASGPDATLPAPRLLASGPVESVGNTGRWRDRWWFVVVPIAAIVALIGIAVGALPDGLDETPTRIELSPPVGVPEQPTVTTPGPQATLSAPGSAAASPSSGAPRPPAPRPTAPPPPPGVRIVGLAGRCMEAAGASSRDGTPVQLGICSGAAAHQRWVVGGDGTLRTLGKCLDVEDGDTEDRTPVVLFRCDGSDSQRWRQSEDGTLRHNESGKCVDVFEGFTDPGTPLILFGCRAGPNQLWRVG